MDAERQRQYAEIYSSILGKIMSGEYSAGFRLVEEELARAYNVSRTPIREVLLALAKDGLVERARNRGAKVAAFTPDDVEQIYDIRQALECLAVRSAIRRISLTDLVALEKRLEALEKEEPGWNQEQAQTDVELHGLIIRNSNNPRLMAYLENISLLIHSLRLIGYRNDHHARQAGREHLAIVRALKDRDLAAAERILADHIDASKKNALEIFSNRHQALQQYSVRPTGSGFSPVLFNS